MGFSFGIPFYVYPPPPPVIYAPPPPLVYGPMGPVQAVPASPPYTDSLGRYCREYRSTAIVEGRRQPIYGMACLAPDGTWRAVR